MVKNNVMNISRDKRDALVILCHYYIFTLGMSQSDLAKVCDVTPGNMNNFLKNTSIISDTDKIYKNMKDEFCKFSYIDSSPNYIRSAIRECYDYPNKDHSELITIEDVFGSISDKDKVSIEALEKQFCGIWHIVRYSAHIGQGPISRSSKDGSLDSWVVRTSCEIKPQVKSIRRSVDLVEDVVYPPKFELRYKPKRITDSKEYLKSEGIMTSMESNGFFIMTGYESNKKFPISIVGPQEIEKLNEENVINTIPQTTFPALVRRRHDRGPVVVSRCVFIREPSADAKLDDFDQIIGVKLESKLKDELEKEFPRHNVDDIIDMMVNNVPNNGKMTLIL